MTAPAAPPTAPTEIDLKPKGLAVLKVAFRERRTLAMLLLGFSAGLPFAMLIGTLNAWLTEEKIPVATIGILSWIGLFGAFRFLWSPAVSWTPPGLGKRLGRRRSWLLVLQVIIAIALGLVALSHPSAGVLGPLALGAALGAFAFATQDIVIDAWRIEVADEKTPIDLLSTVYQLGYRTAALVGGAGSLLMSVVIGWPGVFITAAVLMGLGIVGTLIAPEPVPSSRTAVARERRGSPRLRLIVLVATLAAWGWAAFMLVRFMVIALTTSPAPSAGTFTGSWGPWIVGATVVLPAALAGLIVWKGRAATAAEASAAPKLADTLYDAILAPLVELMGRLGWGAVIVLGLILTYRITDGVWGPFAFPFYMGDTGGALGHTAAEVALASKTFGVIMTIVGIGLGGWALLVIGRMWSLLLGAILSAATNLLMMDLALGAPGIGPFMSATGLYSVFGSIGVGEPLSRLMLAIAGENIAGGFAGAAFVAYLSALSNKTFGAVQFAVFISLALLIGTLGRGALGELIDAQGYAPMFVIAAWMGVIAIVFVLIEWVRLGFEARKLARTGAPTV
ncbi:MAG: beta-lactamase induction signal transducer [Brevundimonas subvibrioides]|uniref:Beta-lactamase induction signal transducer n=1 Tax=Brevundimonas subvibrioides TaxID=74313 RepID=A0A258HI89_9CAUL|nr:beta-lactamase induction signal transducer [Brevundimonas subvibrioides]OYX56048.1 MAG: beta-lactamase induction signal transducer [Brevundimonas subvibrioides]